MTDTGHPNGTTYTEVLAKIPSDQKARLMTRSNRAGLLHLLGHVTALALCSAAISGGVPGWPVFLVLQGILLVFLFTLQHECTHQTPFAAPWMNEFAGHAVGFLLLNPFLWFRYFHLAHHRHTNDPARDPELLSGAKPGTRSAWLWHVSGLPYWFGMAQQVWSNATGQEIAEYAPPKSHMRLRREARVMLIGYVSVAASLFVSPLAFWLWILPALLGQPVLRLYLLAEHGHCPHVANMLMNTRTVFTNRLVRFISWNMPYHIEHHSAPQVPFHQLPNLHRHMAAHLGVTSRGYRAFHREFLRNL